MKDENKTLSKEELNLIEEAECYMEEVNRDPDVANAEPPKEAYDELIAKIRKREEEKEWIRLGKLYKKKRCLRKYFILAAALVLALALGITSLGGGEKIVEIFRSNKLGREQTQVNTEDVVDPIENISEEEAYQMIEDKYGFYPVTMTYRPEGTKFVGIRENNLTQEILLEFENEKGARIFCRIYPNHQKKSQGIDMEDDVVSQFELQTKSGSATIKEYALSEAREEQWSAELSFRKTAYLFAFTNISEENVKKIVKNLNF